MFGEYHKLEGWCTWDRELNGWYYISDDLPVIFNENVLGHFGISRSIPLPIPVESFFPFCLFRVHMAAGHSGYDDMIRLHDFRTAEHLGEVVLVVDDLWSMEVLLAQL